MVLYFPVSALVTLFGNILQNPVDPRAKSDARLMSLVVTFLSMLGQEAEQGGVHRMLGVCSEFVRIAKSVIEKAEKDQSSRRKRKNPDIQKSLPSGAGTGAKSNVGVTTQNARPTTAQGQVHTPIQTHASPANGGMAASSQLSPVLSSVRGSSFGPVASVSTPPEKSPSNASMGWPQEYLVPQQGVEFDSYGDMNDFNTEINSPSHVNGGPFQQPLLPPDLFALPMTLDWNWAEMSGGAYPTVENGRFNDRSSPGMHRSMHQ